MLKRLTDQAATGRGSSAQTGCCAESRKPSNLEQFLGWELVREVEVRKHLRRDEGGHLPDQPSLEREHINRRRNKAPRLRVERIASKGRLSAGARGDYARLSARLIRGETSDHLAASPPAWPWRHGEDGVFREQRGDGGNVASRPGLDVCLNQLADARIAERAQSRLLTPLGKSLLDGLAGTLQRAVH